MNEVAILSGKGGAGKTSLAAGFAALAAGRAVLADCDVDAADLHLILDPQVEQREEFFSGHEAYINPARCTACGQCQKVCRFDAIVRAEAETRLGMPGDASSICRNCSFCVRSCPHRTNAEVRAVMESGGIELVAPFGVDRLACEGCGACIPVCPADAIEFRPRRCGEWMISSTRFGPMVHAALGIGGENSGKLVSTVRSAAKELAEQQGLELVLIDGSPGVGCSVIASVTGADLALLVTEPTPSGLHDVERVAELTGHFKIPAMLCVNKWDINAALADEIEQAAARRNIAPAGRISYDRIFTEAQLEARSVIEMGPGPVAGQIEAVWSNLQGQLVA